MERITRLFVLLGLLVLLLVSTFIILVLILCLARLGQLLDLGLNLQNLVSNNVQVIGLDGHFGLDFMNLLFLYFDLFGEFDQGPVVFLLLQPNIGDFFEQLRPTQLAEILILLISVILPILRLVSLHRSHSPFSSIFLLFD